MAALDVTPTAGETGDAVRATRHGGSELLATRRRLDPKARGRGPRQGVVDPGSCPGDPSLMPAEGNLAAVGAVTLCLINQERAGRGLPALTPNERLAEAALRHAEDMVARAYFSHTSPEGTGPADRIEAAGYMPEGRGWVVGENLAWGAGSLAPALPIHHGWMNSPGHRANILRLEYREIGIGIVLGTPGGGAGATYATTFGAIDGAGADPAAAVTEAAARGRVSARARRACRRRTKTRRALRRCLRRARAREARRG